MAKRKTDDMAAALDALMGGSAAPDDHANDAPEPQSDAPKASDTPEPEAEPSPPVSQSQPPEPLRPASPNRPSTPAHPTPARPTPAGGSMRPATPGAPTPPSRRRPQPTARQPLMLTLGFRQTMIPPLLTAGVLLLIFAALPYVMADDSAFAAVPGWVAILCLVLGIVLLVIAALHMALVNKQLNQSA